MPDDPQASLRAELLGQVVAAQFVLENAIAELEPSGASTSAARSALQALGDLQRQIGTASLAMLAGLRGEVAASAATGRTVAQQSRAANVAETATERLAEASARSRAIVAGIVADVFERRIFDPWLQFGSTEEETAYRQREAERRARIEAEQAKNTPEGDLNASGAAMGQMADAAAHGAGNSPEFKQRWDALVESTRTLRAQLVREGRDVSEFDNRLREDLRRVLKSKGLSDAEIDARLNARADNPLEAVAAYVDENDVGAINTNVKKNWRDSTASTDVEADTAQPAPPPPLPEMTDVMAKLVASGVVMPEQDNEADPSHGVTANNAASPSRTTALS